ncbi:MAG: glycosyltransferase family 2 protein [Candidatus Thiodiazotropha taylori]|nr:glycosyltransferase [Candidatus Thiodiazotropha taylori]
MQQSKENQNYQKVLVITPTYNASHTLERCIQSVKSQSYQNVEHVIIDAISTDNTLDIVEKYKLRFLSEEDRGLYDGMCKGIKEFSGDIIHILNSDDWYANESVIIDVVNYMNKHNLDLCHGYVDLILEDNSIYKTIGEDVNRTALLKKMKIAHPSVFVHSSVYQKYGCYSSCFTIAADYEWLLRVWSNVTVGFIGTRVVNMQYGGLSTTNVVESIRQSASVSILHGLHPFLALLEYYKNRIKNYLSIVTKKSRL